MVKTCKSDNKYTQLFHLDSEILQHSLLPLAFRGAFVASG